MQDTSGTLQTMFVTETTDKADPSPAAKSRRADNSKDRKESFEEFLPPYLDMTDGSSSSHSKSDGVEFSNQNFDIDKKRLKFQPDNIIKEES